MKPELRRTVRQIYDEYLYEMSQVSMALEDIRLSDLADAAMLMDLLNRAEKLEALVDLYAYLLACQDHNQPAR